MSAGCPRALDVAKLLDGELTENRATEFRAHAGACAACTSELEVQRRLLAGIAAPIPGLPSEDGLASILRRLDTAGAPARRWSSLDRTLLSLGGIGVAVAVALAALALLPREAPDSREFTARGATVDWTRKIGVEIWALEEGPRRLSPGDRLSAGTALVGSFSNVDAEPAYLLAFAQDARGEVHWLYPGFVDPRSDPESVRLDASVVHRALPESVTLEGVAPGPLQLVVVVTRAPLRVSSIESAGASGRTLAALRARWPAARVDELSVTFVSPPSSRSVRSAP